MTFKRWKDGKLTSIGVEPDNINEIILKSYSELSVISREKCKVIVFGGGSNSIITSLKKDSFLLRINPENPVINSKNNSLEVSTSAGFQLDALIERLSDKGIHNLNGLSGIPGTIGGAIVQNAGAYNLEISDFIKLVICWDCEKHHIIKLSKSDCCFSRRYSVFLLKPGKYIILEALWEFNIEEASPTNNRFIQIFGSVLPGKILREHILKHREERFPNPDLYPNSGSLFVHPYILKNSLQAEIAAREKIDLIRQYNFYKLPLGAVIEKTGLKGKIITSNLYLSPQHANILCRSGHVCDYREWIEAVVKINSKISNFIHINPRLEPVVMGDETIPVDNLYFYKINSSFI